MLEFQPGHTSRLQELGVLDINQKTITSENLIKKTLEMKNRKIIVDVVETLENEIRNRYWVFRDIELFIEIEGVDLDTLQSSTDLIGYGIYSAQVQIPLLGACATAIHNKGVDSNLFSIKSLETTSIYLSSIEEIQNLINTSMEEKEEYYFKEYERMRQELLSRGGKDINPFDI